MLDPTTRKYVRRRENTCGNVRGVDDVNRNPGRCVSHLAITSAAGLTLNVRRILRMASLASELALTRLREHRKEISDVLASYGASNPRLFGSIAQGNAGPDSDVDLLLDLAPEGSGSRLSRLSGIRLELEKLLKMPVDVACEDLLKDGVSESARSQAIAL